MPVHHVCLLARVVGCQLLESALPVHWVNHSQPRRFRIAPHTEADPFLGVLGQVLPKERQASRAVELVFSRKFLSLAQVGLAEGLVDTLHRLERFA